MLTSTISIINIMSLFLSFMGILIIIFLLLNVYWKRFVIKNELIDIYYIGKKEPSIFYLRAKRMHDIISSFTVLVLYFPIMIIISVLVLIMYPKQSIFVKTLRTGLSGKQFYEIRFRTIDEYNYKRGKFGYFLKNVSINDLPMFINVLKGDLSLVGRSRGIEILQEKNIPIEEPYNRLMSIRPGIVSLWGVSKYGLPKRNDDVFEKLKYDLLYYNKMSLLFDLMITVRTAIVVLGSSSEKNITEE